MSLSIFNKQLEIKGCITFIGYGPWTYMLITSLMSLGKSTTLKYISDYSSIPHGSTKANKQKRK